jgi:S-adenosyl-L-methionine hydrolase (adenosine-forming)
MVFAFLTDFGLQDNYVGVMKGVLASRCPNAGVVDLSHNIPPFSVTSAAYLLYTSWPWFPAGTIFISVVDPGVGTDRRELIALLGGRALIAPDNGTVSLLAKINTDIEFFRAASEVLDELKKNKPWYSSTFDGRDLFSPLAAAVANAAGCCTVTANVLKECGIISEEPVEPVLLADIRGNGKKSIIHIDRFGNCITSLHLDEVADTSSGMLPHGWNVDIPGRELYGIGIVTTFSDVFPGEPLAYWGSSGFLEIGVREGSAAEEFGIRLGDRCAVRRHRTT